MYHGDGHHRTAAAADIEAETGKPTWITPSLTESAGTEYNSDPEDSNPRALLGAHWMTHGRSGAPNPVNPSAGQGMSKSEAWDVADEMYNRSWHGRSQSPSGFPIIKEYPDHGVIARYRVGRPEVKVRFDEDEPGYTAGKFHLEDDELRSASALGRKAAKWLYENDSP